MMPTPAPAPPIPMQAMPAPMYFAATGSMSKTPLREIRTSMARVNRIVEIDAGEDGEHVGLQERDQELERRERDREAERQHGADPADEAERGQYGNETGEHLERDVAGQHVGEQSHAVRDRARQERQHLDEHDQRQDQDRDAARHEQLEEAQA